MPRFQRTEISAHSQVWQAGGRTDCNPDTSCKFRFSLSVDEDTFRTVQLEEPAQQVLTGVVRLKDEVATDALVPDRSRRENGVKSDAVSGTNPQSKNRPRRDSTSRFPNVNTDGTSIADRNSVPRCKPLQQGQNEGSGLWCRQSDYAAHPMCDMFSGGTWHDGLSQSSHIEADR